MRRLMAILALVFGMPPVLAMTLAEPDAIVIGFEAGRSRLTHQGLVAVDRLALRVAECSAAKLSIQLQHDAASPEELTTARIGSVRRRLWQMGLQATYVMVPSKRATRIGEFVRATVGSDQGVWCSGKQRRHLAVWADSLGRYVDQPAQGVPAFWLHMTPEGRRDLALPLAVEAYCMQGEECRRGRATFHWLVAQVALKEPAERRRDWLRKIWLMGEDEDVARLERALGVGPLTVKERAYAADALITSPLSWAVIERRLLEPQLMQAYGELTVDPEGLVGLAAERDELQSLARLFDAAGPAKACLVDGALWYVGATQERLVRSKPYIADWVRGMDPSHEHRRLRQPCDPLGHLFVKAYCANSPKDDVARLELLFQALGETGAVSESPGVKAMTSPNTPLDPWQCRLEPVPGDAFRFRPASQR